MRARTGPPQFDWRSLDPDGVLDAFLAWVQESLGYEPYEAQEEALLELFSGNHVVLNTPTGSGKSLVALGLHVKSLAEGTRSYYTAPIKALVSEKFFDLCELLGAESVGMVTGDGSINPNAPVICATAEILANQALRQGEDAGKLRVAMDEFHYYRDRDRGSAWQLPLLELTDTQFLLMSATLGDMQKIIDSMEERTGRSTAWIKNSERPVPLDFEYRETPLHDTIQRLVAEGKAPIYLVNFSQREASEEAQSLTSLNLLDKDEKKRLKEELRGFRFNTPAGKGIRRFVQSGVGVHHAGLLPKYRRLVERLAQTGLLRVISGTDTLGVGVNIPIRTVLFTKLYKFDGHGSGILSVRDFQQVAGRAGRRGHDTEGSVVCQAPAHEIQNKLNKAKAAAKGSKKVSKQSPPKGYVAYGQDTFRRLHEGEPEALVSSFKVSQSMVLQVLAEGPRSAARHGGFRRIVDMIGRCHEAQRQKRRLRRDAAVLLRALLKSGVVLIDRAVPGDQGKPYLYKNPDLHRDFALNQDLSLYLLDGIFTLNAKSEHYPLDVLSMVEAVQENPRQMLKQQESVLTKEKVDELKAAGIPYDERMKLLEDFEIEIPLKEHIYQSFNIFRELHPWAHGHSVKPKHLTRWMVAELMTFNDLVKRFGFARMEGSVLRYLSESYRLLAQNIPDSARTPELEDVVDFLRAALERTDSSLLHEWEALREEAPADEDHQWKTDYHASSERSQRQYRNTIFQFTRALCRGDYLEAASLLWQPEGYDPSAEPGRQAGIEGAWGPIELERAMRPFKDVDLIADARLREPSALHASKVEGTLVWTQDLLAPEPIGRVEFTKADGSDELALQRVVQSVVTS